MAEPERSSETVQVGTLAPLAEEQSVRHTLKATFSGTEREREGEGEKK